jgi:hypothetical protein
VENNVDSAEREIHTATRAPDKRHFVAFGLCPKSHVFRPLSDVRRNSPKSLQTRLQVSEIKGFPQIAKIYPLRIVSGQGPESANFLN